MSKTGRSSLRLRFVRALGCDGPIYQPSREGHRESAVEGSTTSARRSGSFRREWRWRCTGSWRPVAWPVPAASGKLAGDLSKRERHRRTSRVASAGGVSLRLRHATPPRHEEPRFGVDSEGSVDVWFGDVLAEVSVAAASSTRTPRSRACLVDWIAAPRREAGRAVAWAWLSSPISGSSLCRVIAAPSRGAAGAADVPVRGIGSEQRSDRS